MSITSNPAPCPPLPTHSPQRPDLTHHSGLQSVWQPVQSILYTSLNKFSPCSTSDPFLTEYVPYKPIVQSDQKVIEKFILNPLYKKILCFLAVTICWYRQYQPYKFQSISGSFSSHSELPTNQITVFLQLLPSSLNQITLRPAPDTLLTRHVCLPWSADCSSPDSSGIHPNWSCGEVISWQWTRLVGL